MKPFLMTLWCFMVLTVEGEYYILAPTSQSASPTEPPMTHPTLSAAILEPMPQTAVHYIPSPSTASERLTCGNTQAVDNEVYPAKALAPGPAIPPVLQPTKSFSENAAKNMTKTQI